MACCGKNVKPTLRPSRRLATEPPCLECVEKHIGVSWTLLGEAFDGYRGRLKAIGNLRLAEEHAQAWPVLHDAIRNARKAFQLRGVMPDWAAIERLIADIRDGKEG